MAVSQLLNRMMLKRFRPRRHLSYHAVLLQEMSQSLISMASQSEQEFLLLGEKLQKFSSTFKQLSRQVNLSLQKLGGSRQGEEGRGGEGEVSPVADDTVLANIRHLLESAVTVLQVKSENMAKSLQHMKPVSEGLYQVSKLRDDFQKISRLLRILGTSIKIESNRAGNQGQEFMILGNEIDRIWSHLTGNTEDLLYQAAKSAHLVDSARKRIADNWKHHQTLISGARESILSALSEVEEMVRLSSGAAQGMADRAQAISQEIGEIVCSLQFHDIARQQLEHIHEALDKAGSRLRETERGGEGEGGGGEVAESVFPLLYDVRQSLLVQKSQMENVGREMDQAGIRIRKSLTEIAEKLEIEDKSIFAFCENTRNHEVGKGQGRVKNPCPGIGSSIDHPHPASPATGAPCLKGEGMMWERGKTPCHSSKVQQLEIEISRLASILNQCKGLEEEISQALKPTIQSAAQVEEYMKEMERVGYTINLLSPDFYKPMLQFLDIFHEKKLI